MQGRDRCRTSLLFFDTVSFMSQLTECDEIIIFYTLRLILPN